jgi:hypothetical protein
VPVYVYHSQAVAPRQIIRAARIISPQSGRASVTT